MSTDEVARLAGITWRQVIYWTDRGLVPGQTRLGSGHYREWTPEQIARLRMIGYAVRQADEILASVGLSR